MGFPHDYGNLRIFPWPMAAILSNLSIRTAVFQEEADPGPRVRADVPGEITINPSKIIKTMRNVDYM